MKALDGRPWYRLHLSTWAVIAVTVAVLILIVVPVGPPPNYIYKWGPIYYKHGWPFVCLDRFVSPTGRAYDVDEHNKFQKSQGLRWASYDQMSWTEARNWPISGPCFVRWQGLVLDLAIALAITATIAFAVEWWRRRLWQYTLRSLLVLIFLLSVILAWWRSAAVESAREEDMIATLERCDFYAEQSSAAPMWVCRLVGWDNLPSFVVGINGLDEPPDSRSLQLDEVTAAFAVAKRFRNLERVGLWPADDRSIPFLAALNADLQQLHGSAGLVELQLAGTEVTDAGLEHVKAMTGLRSLAIYNTKITDAGLEHLKGLTQLQELDVHKTSITDAGLEHLEGLKNLEELHVYNTNVTDAGVKKLQQALPNCEISH